MGRQKYSLFHTWMQKIAASRLGAWFFSRTLHHFDRICLKLTGGRVTLANLLSGLPVVVVTTTGSKSGLPRTMPLLYISDQPDSRRFAIVASNWGQRHYPAWYFNLKANPRATCSIRGQVGEYIAHEAEGEEYKQFWQQAVNTAVVFPLYRQRVANARRMPIMIMTPVEKHDKSHHAYNVSGLPDRAHNPLFGFTARSHTSRIMPFLRWWFIAPPHLKGLRRLLHSSLAVGYPIAWLIHLSLIFLFWHWHVQVMSVFNIFSVLFYTSALVSLHHRDMRLVCLLVLLAILEIATHAWLSIVYVGWGFGIHYFMLPAIMVTMLLFKRWWLNALLVGMQVAAFITMYYYSEAFAPLSKVNVTELNTLNIINMVAAFATTAAITLYYLSVAERAETLLEIEYEKSEALLNNILPKVIAARLKRDKATIADRFVNASILFADIVGFTAWSQHIAPDKLVDTLNSIFSRFDELIEKHCLEKIKTIGDAYMVASGVPIYHDNHAETLANFALEMRQALSDYNRATGTNLKLRIGINSGPVVAGVIGTRRFLYDLWGDAVNTASRMESHGVPDEIQVSKTTRDLLYAKFVFEERGVIDIKGRGPMQTYFLRGRAPSGANAVNDQYNISSSQM